MLFVVVVSVLYDFNSKCCPKYWILSSPAPCSRKVDIFVIQFGFCQPVRQHWLYDNSHCVSIFCYFNCTLVIGRSFIFHLLCTIHQSLLFMQVWMAFMRRYRTFCQSFVWQFYLPKSLSRKPQFKKFFNKTQIFSVYFYFFIFFR